MTEKTYYTFRVALNDEIIGEITFDDAKALNDFRDNYEKLFDRKDNKWGSILIEWTDDGK